MTADPGFWKGRKVLITGHTGFKGSWLSLWLQSLSADCVGYALAPPTEPGLFKLAKLSDGMVSIHGDVRDLDHLCRTIEAHRPDVVLHLAAQSVVSASYTDPVETYATNVMGTVNLLEALRRVPGPRAVVNVTTDKCYENREWLWGYRENDRLGGHDPYSNSKACSELVTQSFRDSFFPHASIATHGTALASARAGNVIGGGDWTKDQLIPDIMRAFHDGRAVEIRQPKAVRPWQHVLDCLAGYLLLAEKLRLDGPAHAEAWNFGPALDDAKPVGWIVEALSRKWGAGATWTQDRGSHPHEAGLLRLDHSKSVTQLGWRPRLPLEQALEWTVEWYRAYFDAAPARALCEKQIERYLALAAA